MNNISGSKINGSQINQGDNSINTNEKNDVSNQINCKQIVKYGSVGILAFALAVAASLLANWIWSLFQ